MKKILLLLLVLAGGVSSASADDPQTIYFRTNLNINSINGWSGSNSVYKFEYQGKNPSNESEDLFTYTIDASNFSSDIHFRLWVSGWDYEFAPTCRYHNDGFSYSFSNGQNETYTTNVHWEEYKNQGKPSDWGDNSKDRTFTIPQSTIKATEYKVSLYCNGYTSSNNIYIKVEIVSMPATVSALGYSTFSCNRALDLDNISDGLTAYKASVSDNKVVLTKATGKVVAGTGLLLAGTTGTIPVVETSAASTLTGNLLHGTVTTTNVAASTDGTYHYFLAGTNASDIGFYNLASAADCAAGKAYLETTTALSNDPATSRATWIFLDEEVTGIQNVSCFSREANAIFDLQGRSVNTLKSGLYIKNGKKVFVK